MGFDNFRDNRLLKDYLRIKEEQEEISKNLRKKRNQQQNKERWARYQQYLRTMLADKMLDFAAGSSKDLLLDLFPNAAAAYSLRKLRNAYTDNAIEVRRSSDLAVQDIGFDANGNLDTTTLQSFVNTEITDDINTTTDSNADGLADGLSKLTNNPTATIVTGNGHIGSAQRMEANVGGGTLESIGINTLGTLIGQEITVSFMYRSNISFDLGNGNDSAGGGFASIPANTGDAIRYEHKGVWSPAGGVDGRIQPMWLRIIGQFIEISDWSVTYHTADGHVRTWYDQSGNGNDSLNGTDTQQPLIMDGGTLVTRNGSAAVQADGVNDVMSTTNSIFSTDFGVFAVAGNNYLIGSNYIAFQYGSPAPSPGGIVLGASTFGGLVEVSVQIGTSYTISGSPTSDHHLYYYNRGGSSLDFAIDGGAASNHINSNVIDNVPLELFGISNYSAYSQTFIKELIIYPSDQSSNRTDIEGNINSFYEIYN